jgi:ankyrin repeat protein
MGTLMLLTVLLAKGADVHAVDQRGRSALIYAAAATHDNSAALAKLLLQHGADPQLHSKAGETALLTAVVKGNAQCTQVLVNAGADVNRKCNSILLSSRDLFKGIGSGGKEVITVNGVHSVVLTDGSQQPVPAELLEAVADDWSKTVLMAAATPAVVKVLLAAGADVHTTTEHGNTGLHTAAACNYPAPVICLLIKASVDLQAENSKGKTAAAVAHDKGNTLAAALLNRAAKDV